MIIVTSNLQIENWDEVYGIHFLSDSELPVPWYVKKWGTGYETPPPYLPKTEGYYGNRLNENFHKMRLAFFGQRWMEDLAEPFWEFIKEHNLNVEDELNYIGDDCFNEIHFLKIIQAIEAPSRPAIFRTFR